ncbi:MAG: aldo/keto reductase [Elusimicrobia bacterium]|nr:aldo/keto reductase [Elusimicrobiota bacterium]
MRYIQVGQDQVSVIGLGAWQFGAKEWGWRESNHDEAVRIIERALELGINLIDTAELYGRGRSEELIGEALQGKREKAWLASKNFPILTAPGRLRRAAPGMGRRFHCEPLIRVVGMEPENETTWGAGF